MKAMSPAQIYGLGILIFIFSSPVHAETITVWVKAFIPNSGPGVIVNVPNHTGQTMLNGGPVGCFLTDQRNFDSDVSKSARMTSKISFNISAQGVNNISQVHETGITHKVDCIAGSTSGLCTGQAETTGMAFKNIQFDQTQKIFSMTLEGGASNPCFQFAGINPVPNIHYKILFSFNTNNKTWGLTAITGMFPSFEGYMKIDTRPVVVLFQARAQEFNGGAALVSDRTQLEITGNY
jgi:hypothetical protein